MPAKLDIWNQAIDLIKAKRVDSPDENSLEARTCRLHYPQAVSAMLEGPHDWSFQNRRVALAVLANERTSEWLYAYALPADMGSPIRLIPDLEAAGLGYPVPLPGEPYAETWALPNGAYDTPYLIENGVLYSNTENATLEYGINDIEEADLTAKVADALITDLASRIVVPVKGDRKLRRELMEEADLLWQRAMADDQNRNPRMSGQYVSEAEAARAGYLA